MASKKTEPRVVKQEAEAPKSAQAQLTTLTEEVFTDGDGAIRSGIVAVKAHLTALVIEGDKMVEKPMGTVQAAARMFKTGSRGFYLNGKVPDPSAAGQTAGTKFQVGGNIIAVKSKEW